MSCQDSGPAGHRYLPNTGGGEDFVDMFGDRCYSSGDLFELVWQGGGSGICSMEVQPRLLSSLPAVGLPPEPPSEDEMAAWLYPIVRGEEPVAVQDQPGGDGMSDQMEAPAKESEKTPTTDEKSSQDTSSNSSERRKTTTGARRSHSQHAETHNLTEKRRRLKINEKLKTLQKLVPGCDQSNQASTLYQTIQYIKSLQQQIQAMSFGCGMKPTSAAVHPVVQPPYLPSAAFTATATARLPMLPAAIAPGMLVRGHVRAGVVPGPPPAIVPFAPMIPLLHHPAVMVHASPMLYPNVAPLPARKNRSKLQKKEVN